MEQCDESLRKRSNVSYDRLSDLPEPLILQILSSLPTKLVLTTSVLSKRWRSVHEQVPNLEFESHWGVKNFAENVTKTLFTHKAPILERLSLKLRERCEEAYIGVWLGIAFTRGLRECVLDLGYNHGTQVKLPISLLSFDTLETLKLKECIALDVACHVSMKSLKTLHLDSVVYKGDATVPNLLCSCPNLEHLVVNRGYKYNFVANFAIVSPSLKTLSLKGPFTGKGGYVLNVPSLRYFNIEGLNHYEFCLFENVPEELVEASIRDVYAIANETIIVSLKSAKCLTLDLSPLQPIISYPTGVIFDQLVYLEMCTHKVAWWNLLTLMLDSSPQLQILKLIDESTPKKNLIAEKKKMKLGEWNRPESVPECLLTCLETFVWTRHDWMRDEEKEVAIYVLENARMLKKATFVIDQIESKRHYRLARRRKMLSELGGLVMASESCRVVFESE